MKLVPLYEMPLTQFEDLIQRELVVFENPYQEYEAFFEGLSIAPRKDDGHPGVLFGGGNSPLMAVNDLFRCINGNHLWIDGKGYIGPKIRLSPEQIELIESMKEGKNENSIS